MVLDTRQDESIKWLSAKRNLTSVLEVNRVDHFLALRGFACLVVLIGHCHLSMPSLTNNFVVFERNCNWFFQPHASFGMYVFFTLSGYLMGNMFFTKRFEVTTRGVTRFAFARVVRIIPLFYSLMLFYLIFDMPEFLRTFQGNQLLKVFTFTYNIWPFEFRAAHFWSIAVEMQFYLLVPLLFVVCRRCCHNPFALFFTLSLVVVLCESYRNSVFPATVSPNGVLNVQNYWRKIYFPLTGNFDVFFVGFWLNMLFAWLDNDTEGGRLKSIFKEARSNIRQFRWPMPIAWITLIAACVLTSYLFHRRDHLVFLHYGVFNLLTATATVFFIAVTRSLEAGVRNVPLNFQSWRRNMFRTADCVGLISYGIYCWHIILLVQTYKIFAPPSNVNGYVLICCATIVLSVVFAASTYVSIERPFNKLRHRYFT